MKYFHEVSLPQFVSIYARGGPCFHTIVVSSVSGREARSTSRTHSLQQYQIKDCKLNNEQFAQLNAFFRARQGMMYGFRMRDHADHTVNDQQLAVGDGQKTQFQLFKSYRDDLSTYQRPIYKPIADSVIIKVNGTVADFNCNSTNGMIKLANAPQQGASITASFIFEVPVRFEIDNLTYHLGEDGSIIIDPLKVVEVLI